MIDNNMDECGKKVTFFIFGINMNILFLYIVFFTFQTENLCYLFSLYYFLKKKTKLSQMWFILFTFKINYDELSMLYCKTLFISEARAYNLWTDLLSKKHKV